MFVAALLVIPTVVIDVSAVSSGWKTCGAVLNWVVWSAFAVEFVTMLRVTEDRREWLRKHPLEVAIVFLTPPFLPAALQSFRLFRLLRLFRLAVVVKNTKRLFTVDGLRLGAVLAGVAALGGGAIFSAVEKGYSLWDGVWWAISTMSTVGYGDLAPHTVAGRVLAIGLMFVGVGFFALVTGAVAQRFISTEIHDDVVEVEAQIVSSELAVRDDVVRELRAISRRLLELEQAIQRL